MKRILFFFMLLVVCAFPVFAQTKTFNWEFAGWHGGGCYPNVEFDPAVKNRVYLTSDVAGIWRSDDLGNNWYFVNKGLGGLMVTQVAIAPGNSNLLYAATHTGVYYSLDAAQSWNASDTVGGKIAFYRPDNYRSLAIDPTNTARICVGTKFGEVYCSSNYGKNWENIPLPSSSTLEKKPISSTFITRDGQKLVVAFTKLVAEYSFKNKAWTVLGQFKDPITDMIEDKFVNRIYVASGNKFWYMQQYMPGSWVASAAVPEGNVYRIALSHPTSTTVQVYVAWLNGWRGGVISYNEKWQNWMSLDYNFYPDLFSDPTRMWASILTHGTSLKINPHNPNVLFRTDFWGVWRSDYSGYSWVEKIMGAPNTVASDIAVMEDGSVYVGSMDNGLLKSANGGKSYQQLFPTVYADNTAGHIWRFVKIGPRIVATSSPWNKNINQVIVSENNGLTFQVVNNGIPSRRPTVNTMWGEGYPKALVVDPNDPKTIYLGIDGDDGGGLYVSSDGGYTWKQTPGQPGSLRVYHGLAVNPRNSNNIVWGAAGNNGGVYVSKDKARSFTYALRDMQWVFNVAIDPNGIIYAGGDSSGPALYVSDATQTNFRLLKHFAGGVGHAVDGIAINPKDPKMIAVSTVNWNSQGPCKIYLTRDAGATWEEINGNLPDGTGASAMTFDPQGKYLYIARYAGSIYRVNVN